MRRSERVRILISAFVRQVVTLRFSFVLVRKRSLIVRARTKVAFSEFATNVSTKHAGMSSSI